MFRTNNQTEKKNQSDRELERKIVARFSRGNIRLQQGKYITQEDIDEGFEYIKNNLLPKVEKSLNNG